MSDVCGDNRFEIIEAYKKRLIEDTNIESRPEEMAVIDNILLRFWQMGWLPSAQPEPIKLHVDHALTEEEIKNLKQKIADSSIVLMPSAQPEERELHESCTDCPLYDHERHSCPRFNKVIPETLREARQEIIHCKDCVYWDSLPSSSLAPEYHDCVERPFHISTTAEDFCSRAERRHG